MNILACYSFTNFSVLPAEWDILPKLYCPYTRAESTSTELHHQIPVFFLLWILFQAFCWIGILVQIILRQIYNRNPRTCNDLDCSIYIQASNHSHDFFFSSMIPINWNLSKSNYLNGHVLTKESYILSDSMLALHLFPTLSYSFLMRLQWNTILA